MARSAAGTGALEICVHAVPAVVAGGGWERLFKALSTDPEFEYVLVDATISKVHADATSQKGGLKLSGSATRKAV